MMCYQKFFTALVVWISAAAGPAFAEITLTDASNLILANSQVESGADVSENPDVTGGSAGPLLDYTETGANSFGCCGPDYGRQNLNDGDVGLNITSDGLYAIADTDGAPLVFDFGSTVTVKSIAIYNGYKNRDDGDYLLSDGSGNTLGAWTILTPPPGGGNDGVDSFWLTFETPVVTDQLILSYVVADCCGTPSFREIQIFQPKPDTDGDGMPDDFEDTFGLDKNNPDDADEDQDNDDLSNLREFTKGTDPTEADSDGDLLEDGDEVLTHGTDPNLADTDEDGLSDHAEVTEYLTDPILFDSDGDGLGDGDEINGDPATDPLLLSSDSDPFGDGTEIWAGSDPNDGGDFPAGPTFVLDATTLALAPGAEVDQWNGQSAVGTPLFNSGQTPGGGPAVSFDGFANFGEIEIPATPSGDFIIAAVLRPNDIAAYHNIIDDRERTRPMLWVDANFNYEFNFGGGMTPAVGGGSEGWDIVIADARNNELYVNSGTANGTGREPFPYQTTELFDLFHREGAAQDFNGEVAELRIYNDAGLFHQDFAALHDELFQKWFGGGSGNRLNILVQPQSNGDITLTWNSQIGRSYEVEASFDLSAWFNIAEALPAQGENTSFTEAATNIPPNSKARFYRVIEIP